MESLAQQTSANAALKAEVRTLKEAAALRQRALKFSPSGGGGGGEAPVLLGEGVSLMGEAAVSSESERIRLAALAFEKASETLEQVKAQARPM